MGGLHQLSKTWQPCLEEISAEGLVSLAEEDFGKFRDAFLDGDCYLVAMWVRDETGSVCQVNYLGKFFFSFPRMQIPFFVKEPSDLLRVRPYGSEVRFLVERKMG